MRVAESGEGADDCCLPSPRLLRLFHVILMTKKAKLSLILKKRERERERKREKK